MGLKNGRRMSQSLKNSGFAKETNRAHLAVVRYLYKTNKMKQVEEYVDRHKMYFTEEKYLHIKRAIIKSQIINW